MPVSTRPRRTVQVRIGRIEVVVPPPAPLALPPAPVINVAPAPRRDNDLLARLWLDRVGYER